jgi:hypothetical protein
VISAQSTVAVCQNQVYADLDGEAVILNLDTGIYHGLNETGCTIWHLIQSPRTVSEICAALLAEYDVTEERCLREVLTVLGQMAEAGIVELRDAQTA